MVDTLPGLESSAVSLLTRAVEMDTAKRFTEALVCYREGIQILLEARKATNSEEKRANMAKRIEDYMTRAEKLKEYIAQEKAAGKYHEQIRIENNSTGHSYDRLFGSLVDDVELTTVEVEDPYVRSTHQIYNFVRFCEMLVKRRCKVAKILLLTGVEEHDSQRTHQQRALAELAGSLTLHRVQLHVEYSPTLHDREIRFNNGWVLKIGRGLDIYKPPAGKFVLGYCDYDLRPCHETTVDIFHRNQLKMRST